MTEARTLGAALDEAARTLTAAGIAHGRHEARLMAEHTLGIARERVIGHPEQRIAHGAAARFDGAVRRRAAREPLAYVTGVREFWSLPFAVTPATLIPRPDSETLVQAALSYWPRTASRKSILDLGTGSGCLLLALLHERPAGWGVGIDIARDAAAVARRNAETLGLAERARFAVSDWGDAITGAFEIIVSNPPYVDVAALGKLAPEIAEHEPRVALAGGADGLDAYRRLAPVVQCLLAQSGVACIELGAGMAEPVGRIFEDESLVEIERRNDLAGIPRCAIFTHPGRSDLPLETDG